MNMTPKEMLGQMLAFGFHGTTLSEEFLSLIVKKGDFCCGFHRSSFSMTICGFPLRSKQCCRLTGP